MARRPKPCRGIFSWPASVSRTHCHSTRAFRYPGGSSLWCLKGTRAPHIADEGCFFPPTFSQRRWGDYYFFLQLPAPSHRFPLLQIVQILDQPLVKSFRTGIHRIVRGVLERDKMRLRELLMQHFSTAVQDVLCPCQDGDRHL